MSDKFKYRLLPEQQYILEFEDFEGKPFKVEVSGEEILSMLRRRYALDKLLEENDFGFNLVEEDKSVDNNDNSGYTP